MAIYKSSPKHDPTIHLITQWITIILTILHPPHSHLQLLSRTYPHTPFFSLLISLLFLSCNVSPFLVSSLCVSFPLFWTMLVLVQNVSQRRAGRPRGQSRELIQQTLGRTKIGLQIVLCPNQTEYLAQPRRRLFGHRRRTAVLYLPQEILLHGRDKNRISRQFNADACQTMQTVRMTRPMLPMTRPMLLLVKRLRR